MAHDDPACAVPPPCMAHIFVGVGPRPARLIYILGPRIFISWGCFAAAAASDFCHGAKVTKKPFKGEMFRFISPLKIPLFTDQSRPRKLQITRLARKGKTRSFRYSSSPNGNRLCWISIGLPFRPPLLDVPPGDGRRGTKGREKNAIM